MADSEARNETALAVFCILLSGLFIYEGLKLKPGVFEPIGPGAVPVGVACVTLVLSVVVLIARFWKPLRRTITSAVDDVTLQGVQPENWRLMSWVGGLTLLYVAILHAGLVRYGPATVGYLLVCFLGISGNVRRALPWALALALLTGFGLDYVFRHLLVADLS